MIKFMDMIFDWDENKARLNKRKHGVSFLEAMTAFADDNALLIDDEDHSYDEKGFILLGISNTSNLLMVCHCYRDKDAIIRLISARKAKSLFCISISCLFVLTPSKYRNVAPHNRKNDQPCRIFRSAASAPPIRKAIVMRRRRFLVERQFTQKSYESEIQNRL